MNTRTSPIHRPKCVSEQSETEDKMLAECGGAENTSVSLLRPPTQCAMWEADAERLVYFSPWICELFSSLFLPRPGWLIHTPAGNKATLLHNPEPQVKANISLSIHCG